MMWLAVVLAGHFANAGAFVVDKILLTKDMKHPSVYVFYIGVLGISTIVLVPFASLHALSPALMTQSAIAGATFMGALLFFFSALQRGSTSRVVPIVGALIPVWTLGFALLYLGERVQGYQGYGILLLILGAMLISYESTSHKDSVSASEACFAVVAAALFAFSYTITKVVFNQTEFLNGFLWMRFFSFLTVLPLLIIPVTRQAVFGGRSKERPGPLFFFGQTLGAIGFFLLNVGLKLAPKVSIVNALQGIQYAFLFILIMLLSRLDPLLLRERFSPRLVIQKIIAIFILGIGLVLAAVV